MSPFIYAKNNKPVAKAVGIWKVNYIKVNYGNTLYDVVRKNFFFPFYKIID